MSGVRMIRTTVALLALCGAVTACGDDDATSSPDGGETTEGQNGGENGGGVEPRTIAIFVAAGNAEINQRVQASTEAAVEALGWESRVADGEADPTKIQQRCEAMVNQGPDALVLIQTIPAIQQGCLEAAEAAGIPVVSAGLASEETPLVAGQFVGDDRAFSQLLLDEMANDLTEGSQISAINLPNIFAATERQAEFEPFAESEGWDVVAEFEVDLTNLFEGTTQAGIDQLNANPDLEAIWSCCDFGGAALLPSLTQTGRDDVHIYSFYAISPVRAAIRAGQVTVVEEDNVKTGPMAIDALVRFFEEGEAIDAAASLADNPVQRVIVNAENAPADDEEVFPADEALEFYLERWRDAGYIDG